MKKIKAAVIGVGFIGVAHIEAMLHAVVRNTRWLKAVDGLRMLVLLGMQLQQALAQVPVVVGIVKVFHATMLRIQG